MSLLLTAGQVTDPSGMASTALAEAVGYPGSSIAFAQLLSGMERAGLIEREIRGKRTYRIAAAPAAAAEFAAPGVPLAELATRNTAGGQAGAGAAARGGAAGGTRARTRAAGQAAVAARRAGRSAVAETAAGALTGTAGELDYDELARRLLVQVVQQLAGAPAAGAGPGRGRAADAELQQTVAGLEQKLASVQSKQRRLTAENARLREQLRAAQQSLALAEERAQERAGGQLDTAEVLLLERLLSPLRGQQDRREEAGAG